MYNAGVVSHLLTWSQQVLSSVRGSMTIRERERNCLKTELSMVCEKEKEPQNEVEVAINCWLVALKY